MFQCYVSTQPSSNSRAPAPSAADQFMDSVDDELDSFLYENDTYGGEEELMVF
jgi:hypothetical protein